MHRLLSLNLEIKKEADEILYKKGLFSILSAFGLPYVTGSYSLDLMTWRDLDIYLQADELTETDFFGLGCRISSAFKPVKMSFRNERIAQTKHLPHGWYWGVCLGDERAGAWKIDIWVVDTAECQRLVRFCTDIKQQLTPAATVSILSIKSQCWQDSAYRRSYTSLDIYRAVLEGQVRDVEGFRRWLGVMGL
jgi:hypothetical protein